MITICIKENTYWLAVKERFLGGRQLERMPKVSTLGTLVYVQTYVF